MGFYSGMVYILKKAFGGDVHSGKESIFKSDTEFDGKFIFFCDGKLKIDVV